MKKYQEDRLWKDVSILCQLLGHLLSDLAEKGGFVGRVEYARDIVPFVADIYCGWADARIRFADVWKQHWSDSVLPRSKLSDIHTYARRMRRGADLPPIMVCRYDDGDALVDGNRRCAALMLLTPEERAQVVMPAFIIDLRSDENRENQECDAGGEGEGPCESGSCGCRSGLAISSGNRSVGILVRRRHKHLAERVV